MFPAIRRFVAGDKLPTPCGDGYEHTRYYRRYNGGCERCLSVAGVIHHSRVLRGVVVAKRPHKRAGDVC